MKTNRCSMTIAMMLALVCTPALAADRVHAGQWTGTTVVGGHTYPTSSCITQSDADALNGDANAVSSYLAKIIPAEVCKISDIKVTDTQIIYSAACAGGAPKVVTTMYRGDSSEGSDSTGAKIEAKRVGACKQ
jgi:hypothetical protein